MNKEPFYSVLSTQSSVLSANSWTLTLRIDSNMAWAGNVRSTVIGWSIFACLSRTVPLPAASSFSPKMRT